MMYHLPCRKNRQSSIVNRQFQRGFTLIELLVVIVIIGILSALLMANFVGIRQRARDGQRKGDLRQIQSALELYRADVGNYPAKSGKLNAVSCPNSGAFVNGNSTYMQKIPCDPLGSTAYNSGNYYYNSNGASYDLCAGLENTEDSQRTNMPASGGSCPEGIVVWLKNP